MVTSKPLIILALLLIIGGVWYFTSSNQQETNDSDPKHPGQYFADEYTPDELQNVLDNPNILILDVRTEEEYDKGHVPGAINIEYNDIEGLANIDKNKEVVVYCTLSSWRAPYAAYTITKAGHENVKLLRGGARDWDDVIGILEANDSGDAEIVHKPEDLEIESPTETSDDSINTTTFNSEIISQFNGVDGSKAFIAYDGFVYDVTESPLWENGSHRPAIIGGFIEVKAGQDITKWLEFAPHGKDNVERFPKVGIYIE